MQMLINADAESAFMLNMQLNVFIFLFILTRPVTF